MVITYVLMFKGASRVREQEPGVKQNMLVEVVFLAGYLFFTF